MKFDLNDKIAIVTGASQGIGETIAVEMAKSGANVFCIARNKNALDSTINKIISNGDKASAYSCDISNNKQFNNIVTDVFKEYGSIDILVNNAGITNDTLLMRMKEEDWDSVINTNLKSVYKLSQAVIKSMMKKRYGRIINISSVVGHTGNAGQTNYAATKAGISGFTKSLAQEIGSREVTVNCVAPGFIDTDMTRALSEDQRQQLLGHIPLGRLGSPIDVAHAVCYLASDLAGYVTGETIHVNGGMLMI